MTETCIYCSAPVEFGRTRCNTETCYLGHIGRIEARLASAQAELTGAQSLIRELTEAQSDSENYWHIRGQGAERRERELGELYREAQAEVDALRSLSKRDDWDEEDGDVLWWNFPIVEPPYCGTPLDDGFPDYVTHWTPLLLPSPPEATEPSGAPPTAAELIRQANALLERAGRIGFADTEPQGTQCIHRVNELGHCTRCGARPNDEPQGAPQKPEG